MLIQFTPFKIDDHIIEDNQIVFDSQYPLNKLADIGGVQAGKYGLLMSTVVAIIVYFYSASMDMALGVFVAAFYGLIGCLWITHKLVMRAITRKSRRIAEKLLSNEDEKQRFALNLYDWAETLETELEQLDEHDCTRLKILPSEAKELAAVVLADQDLNQKEALLKVYGGWFDDNTFNAIVARENKYFKDRYIKNEKPELKGGKEALDALLAARSVSKI